MTTQVYLVFTITILHNYIKDHTIKEIDYFEEEIDEEMVLVSTFNIVFLDTLLAIYICSHK